MIFEIFIKDFDIGLLEAAAGGVVADLERVRAVHRVAQLLQPLLPPHNRLATVVRRNLLQQT